jgi:hypothetical protein
MHCRVLQVLMSSWVCFVLGGYFGLTARASIRIIIAAVLTCWCNTASHRRSCLSFHFGGSQRHGPPHVSTSSPVSATFLYISRRLQMHFTVDSRLAWHQQSFFKRSEHVNFKHCCRRSTFVAPRQLWRRCRFILNEFQAAASAQPFCCRHIPDIRWL